MASMNIMNNKRLSLAKDKIRFLLLEGVHADAAQNLRQHGYDNIVEHKAGMGADELRNALADTHFLGIRSRSQISAEIIAAAPRLTAIGCFCIGTNQVDLDAAAAAGIPVFNAPYSNTRSVAELALAEIILLLRGIPQKNAAAHRGQWLKSAVGSFEVRGKTLGIIGYGHIGTQLGILAENLGMRVLFYDIENKLPLGNAGAMNSQQELLANSDVVTLHVPATEQTANMITATELAQMKPGAHLLNLARGNIIDIDALHDALESGHLAGAALDVYPQEPKSNDDAFVSKLQKFDQVILSPHIGGSTLEAQQNIALEVTSKLIRYSDNGSTQSAVNFPEVSLPDNAGSHRIMHIHHNEPGVLQQINQLISSSSANIAAQYLQTRDQLGYVIIDVETDDASDLLKQLHQVPATIRCRVLY